MLRRYKKGIAIVLLLTFGQEIFLPSTLWALTGGPSQPEVNSFEPVGTNQMVDLSTGDFNYNIPLMVVPGPNGGYPINLAYHAGIGMEQEASWVGLGWNINPGAITRNLRGVPDDFSGDEIKEEMNLKDEITNGISVRIDQLKDPKAKEILGLDVNKATPRIRLNVYRNNYRGVGYAVTFRPFPIKIPFLKDDHKLKNTVVGNVLLNYDSQTGLGMEVSASLGGELYKNGKQNDQEGYNVGFGIHSRQGLQSIRFNGNKEYKKRNNKTFSTSISFTNSGYIPGGNFSRSGNNSSIDLTISKTDAFPIFKKGAIINVQRIKNGLLSNAILNKSYGSIYSEKAGLSSSAILDINVHNDIPISKRSVNMGMPVMNSDVFSISGQGVGGVFRAHRNDIGKFYDAKSTSDNVSIVGGSELGVGAYSHFGIDFPITLGGSSGYSGKWKGGANQIADIQFKFNSKLPRYEKFYFKVVGEQTANDLNYWDNELGEEAVAFDLGMTWEGASPKPKAKNTVNGTDEQISNRSENVERVKRIQNIAYKTKGDLINNENYTYEDRVKHIYGFGQFPGFDGVEGGPIDYESMGTTLASANKEHHIHEYTILRPDGSTYTYGLPAYNEEREEVVFANTSSEYIPGDYNDLDRISYAVEDASLDNNEGVDNYYSSTQIPAYVHAHMITEITSADYVDLTDNGPSEDDFGFYAKFNYSTVNDYQWREPFYDADYIKGFYSNDLDDKASFAHGQKDLYYVNSIETKTHIAVFELGDRADGRGVSSRDQKLGDPLGESQKYLKKIILYSKNDPHFGTSEAIPLQTIYFEYDYSLCQGIDNNGTGSEIDDVNHIQNDQGGKLTLKRVYITYNGNTKGRLSPYEFDYTSNENYSRLNLDRWGNYQESEDENEHAINPYTRQDLSINERNHNASAWCLSQINLPSGGEINVEYESDDYGYVQDVRATQMVEIYGFSKADDDHLIVPEEADSDRLKVKNKNIRLWFRADGLEGLIGDERHNMIADYIEGLDEVYFKIYQSLKRPYGGVGSAKDYVVGYARVNKDSYGADPENNFGYIDLLKEKYNTAGLDVIPVHPMRKAGWQYLKYSRPDLFNNIVGEEDGGSDPATVVYESLVGFVEGALSVLTLGEYNQYNISGYARKISLSKDSFVRLNSPDKRKYGGGHRVASIKLSDNWIEQEHDLQYDQGTTYEYKNEDGTTSGVADYEPIVGGEENALRKPIWYSEGQLLNFQHRDAYQETPIAEALYPSPRIVYGRVVVKSLADDEDVTKSQAGIVVNEFYTAKDFPVISEYTSLEHKGYNFAVYIPFVGMIDYQNNGYSQGYKVVTNDMSGRPKAVSNFPYRTGVVEGEPINEIRYRYHTDASGGLDNTVNVLDSHGEVREAIVGVEQDFVLYNDEHKSAMTTLVNETNVDVFVSPFPPPAPPVPPVPIPTLYFGHFNHSESMYRGIVTNKIIHKTGILKEVEVFSEGSTVVTENVLFDAETGEALLTQVNNEWDKPVYNYSYAAHWAYDRMGGAYKNYRAKVIFSGSAGNLSFEPIEGVLLPNENEIFVLGDELSVEETDGVIRTYYVSAVNDNSFALENSEGINMAFTEGAVGIITRSGRRNLQAVKSGSVVALKTNFLAQNGELSQQFALWNSVITGADPQAGIDDPTYFDLNTMSDQTYTWEATNYFVPNRYSCNTGEFANFNVEVSGVVASGNTINFVNGACQNSLNFYPNPEGETPAGEGFIDMTGEVVDNGVGGTVISYSEDLVDFEIISEEKDEFGNPVSVVMRHIPSGKKFPAIWTGGNDCWRTCDLGDVLHADAITFSDDWSASYPYEDLGNPVTRTGELIEDGAVSSYKYGKKGIWRAKRTYLYQINREQSGTDATQTRVNVDGEYEPWRPFNWRNEDENPEWDWVSEVTKYSPYGYALEERSRLSYGDGVEGITENSIYSSQMYGYENSLVIATSALARYYEIGFTGFEQKDAAENVNNTGHLSLSYTGAYEVSTDKQHTGTNSLKIGNGDEIDFIVQHTDEDGTGVTGLQGIAGKSYVISLWVNVESTGAGGQLNVEKLDGSLLKSTTTVSREIIDGWKKLALKFTMPNAGDVKVKYVSSGDTYIDDYRFGPFDGGLVTYVYDRNNLWLMAELDGLNYATFYNYDSEGNLVQVKKETEKGIVTVQMARSNTQRITP